MQRNPEPLTDAVLKRWIAVPRNSTLSFTVTLNGEASLFMKKQGRYTLLARYESGGLIEEYYKHCIDVSQAELAKLPFLAFQGKIETKWVAITVEAPEKHAKGQ